ncbi:MAG: NusG antitermination factor, transcriptional antiterminator NusG [Candidatus Gottesmanbacteria bacterium GW2011_GWC1_43_10]|nr:MAG: NusG antitermination factor, transcriptional antiterminator NusG [Candidatus Gottesmanbacteria bacterium GW2011_GWC1_43_10]
MTDTPTQPDPKTPVTTPEPSISDQGSWYVVHTYSGHENKVATTLKQRVETMSLQHKIFDIVVPTRNIVTVRHGKKEEIREKIINPPQFLTKKSQPF